MIYGSAAWDPILIISQIASLQCLFYLTMGIFNAMFLSPFLGQLSVLNIFGWQLFSIGNIHGWLTIASNLATACLGAVYLMWIVERAKKCLDFGSTTYLIHFTCCWAYSGFPANLIWWGTNAASFLIMALFGEWLCVRRELAEIPLSAMRGRVDAMRGGDVESGNLASANNGVPNGGGGSGVVGSGTGIRGSGIATSVIGRGSVEMSGSSGVMPRSVTSVTTRLLGSDVIATNRSGSGAT
ncbi:hypothetical protein CEUSTIGMA_g4964.t1 [Chlamydomonas eustigma]|uniref:Protein SYS1 homolog n=1 Tax=Chlamydomonas eustigma TaxID=1157962 RepID=A0A250X442_9CHLO|nr:hypothetical protein CEUSTIGMA_g4964.t1 [Chlamydomonas eustigma]|eukprot:GAX77520.1 hypothetical protein CEUSTIGMA_g4964.t1 [Chlamydomonas eustigma]